MTIYTGTPNTRTEHSTGAASAAVALGVGVPAIVAIVGVISSGFGAISWGGAIVWGIVATVAFTAVSIAGEALGITNMDLLDLLGSISAPPGTSTAKALGLGIHLTNGALLAIAGAYGADLIGLSLNWAIGLVWGFILWALALMMMTGLGAVHPAIRQGRQRDPGPAAKNFGPMTPVGSLIGHAVYGALLGVLYQTWSV